MTNESEYLIYSLSSMSSYTHIKALKSPSRIDCRCFVLCVVSMWFNPCYVLPVQFKSWRTQQQSVAALWTVKIHMPPLKICQACLSAHRRAATWKWSLQYPETEHTPKLALHHATPPHCTQVTNMLDLFQLFILYDMFFIYFTNNSW